ncbi:MAG: acyltransferase [Chamaesiphon sp.]|nr:acyltransferase [Chamaesiphon sp.]
MDEVKLVGVGEKLDYIDIARGIAILMVMLVHTSQAVNGVSQLVDEIDRYGQMGVQLFFVASAYTLCFSSIKRAEEKQPLISFLIRRFFRIAPLYYVAMIGYFLLESNMHILALIRMPYSLYNFETIAANILFIHGFVLSANNNIVPGGWSIGTEMAFYLIFPILFALFDRAYKQSGITALYSLVGLSILLNISVQLSVQQLFKVKIDDNSFIYYNLINQLPVFLMGMTIFFHHHYRIPLQLSLPIQTAIFIVVTIIGIIILPSKQYWLVATCLPVIAGISFVFLLSILKESKYSNIFLTEIGRVSYSMYIFHFMFAWYLVPGIGLTLKKGILPELLLVCSITLVIQLTFAVAKVSHKYIETPGIWIGKILISKPLLDVRQQ